MILDCMTLLYPTFVSCLIGSNFNYKECGTDVKDFKPIYAAYDCGYCSKDTDLMIKMLEMIKDNKCQNY